MDTLSVRVGSRPYDIFFAGGLSGFAPAVRSVVPKAHLAFVVGDTNVEPKVRAVAAELEQIGLRVETALIPAGEPSKNLFTAAFQYDRLAEMKADRSTLVVALGGGVVGDLAGFVAATYNRGLPLVMVPTTLLAMVDSSVGGKVGLNHPQGKNLIGAFHQPSLVWIGSDFLKTLPEREYRSGLAEVVKMGVALDAELFSWLETSAEAILQRDESAIRRIVRRSCELKAGIVERDEREETGLRAVLNYGHTFGHAFEAVGGYGSWLHGEAVSAGMVCASILAERLGRIDADVTRRQVALLNRLELPVGPKPEWPIASLIESMQRDKKAIGGKLRFVLPTRLGHVELVDGVSEDVVSDVLKASGAS